MKCSAIRILWLAFAAAALGACTQSRPPDYADRYQAALARLPGTTAVTPAMTERFVAFFSHSENAAAANTPADPAELYGDPLYFSDTLLTTSDRDTALRHLRRMRDNAESLKVRVIDEQVSGQDVYLVWQMEAVFQPLGRPVTSNTIGVTHLRFDDAGRIILHQDFWDSAEGLYRHLPVLGSLIQTIRGRFDDPAD